MKYGRFGRVRLFLSSLYDTLFVLLYLFIIIVIVLGEFLRKFLFLPLYIIIKIITLTFGIFISLLRKILQLFRFKIRSRFLHLLLIKLKYFLIGSFVTFFVLTGYQAYIYLKSLPSPYNIGKTNFSLSTHIYDRNGKLLYEIYRDQNRTPIKLRDLPAHITKATVAVEDKDFYRHKGISLTGGILRAAKENILKGQLQGGSTITQQLVKSSLLNSERTLERKIKEMALAIWTEQLFTKDQILEMYLNQVPYGGSSYGIEEAAKIYFGKSAKELTLSEAALLAGLPQAPTIYSPFVNPALAVKRRNEILSLMHGLKFISQKQMKEAQKEELKVAPIATKILAPHFVFFVKSELEEIYGVKRVEEGGLEVTTTLEISIQKEAEKILAEELEKIKELNVTNGGILITRPSTGEIVAMVGSVDYFASPYGAFNVTTALRQPGSSIKPLMYSLALEKSYTAATIIEDSPVTFYIPGGQSYHPVNYDGAYHGRIPLRLALANSYNVPAVKVLNTLGVQNFVKHSQRLGITTWGNSSRFGLSLTLGGGEIKMVDMGTAFAVFANQGYKIPVSPLMTVSGPNGTVLHEFIPERTKVVDEGIAYIVSDILSDNFARQLAFGARSSLEIEGYKVAVKTGTTDDKKDNWTIGYTPEFLVAVWVGNNDNTPMHPFLTSGITGAAPIWNRTMSYLLKTYGNNGSWLKKPENVVEKVCFFGRVEYFLKGTENSVSCKDSSPTPSPRRRKVREF